MSGGLACRCPESKKPIERRRWRVLQLYHNQSAFSGYRFTSSDWSSVCCDACKRSWRTKAAYVTRIVAAELR